MWPSSSATCCGGAQLTRAVEFDAPLGRREDLACGRRRRSTPPTRSARARRARGCGRDGRCVKPPRPERVGHESVTAGGAAGRTESIARSRVGTNRSALATTASWAPSTRNASALGDQVVQRRLAGDRHDLVAHRDHVRHRHVDRADPLRRRERADRLARFEHHPPVVARRLSDRPRLPLLRLALQEELVGEPRPWPGRA